MSGLIGLKKNEDTKDMIVHDADYLGWADQYGALGRKLEAYTRRYIAILKATAELSSGQFSDNLRNFTEVVNTLLSGNAEGTLTTLQGQMKGYIDELDIADGTWA